MLRILTLLALLAAPMLLGACARNQGLVQCDQTLWDNGSVVEGELYVAADLQHATIATPVNCPTVLLDVDFSGLAEGDYSNLWKEMARWEKSSRSGAYVGRLNARFRIEQTPGATAIRAVLLEVHETRRASVPEAALRTLYPRADFPSTG